MLTGELTGFLSWNCVYEVIWW